MMEMPTVPPAWKKMEFPAKQHAPGAQTTVFVLHSVQAIKTDSSRLFTIYAAGVSWFGETVLFQ